MCAVTYAAIRAAIRVVARAAIRAVACAAIYHRDAYGTACVVVVVLVYGNPAQVESLSRSSITLPGAH